MSGGLYLSSIRDYKTIDADLRYEITRYPKLMKDEEVTQLLSLAPSPKLLKWFKSQKLSDNVLLTYYNTYKDEINNSISSKKSLNLIKKQLDAGADIQLICFCSDYHFCHRTIIGKWFEDIGYHVYYG